MVLHHFGALNYLKSQQIPSKKPSAEKSSPQMKADQKMFRPKWKQIIFLIRPKCRKTFMMIVHLKRGGRVYLTTTSAFCIEISNTIEDFMWKGNSYYIIKLTVEKYSLSEDRKFIRH